MYLAKAYKYLDDLICLNGMFWMILLKLPEDTILCPGHDYNGKQLSTIGNEKKFNPRLQVRNVDEYVELMSNLNLAKPKLIDINVSRNIKLGAN